MQLISQVVLSTNGRVTFLIFNFVLRTRGMTADTASSIFDITLERNLQDRIDFEDTPVVFRLEGTKIGHVTVYLFSLLNSALAE